MRHEIFNAGRLVQTVEDRGDGTGTRTIYRPDGTVEAVEELTGLPIPEPVPDTPPPLTPEEQALANTLIRDLISRGGELWDHLAAIAPTNTARPAIAAIAEPIIEAAIASLPPEET